MKCGSRYNLVVTNTEKIRIQKRTYRHPTWTQMYFEHMLEQAEEEANLRLQAIASLPKLGVFSDEAHHTYGREVGASLKWVRQMVNYLHEKTDLICVVNTTGTPYYERQPLWDVVIWYGLSEDIRHNNIALSDVPEKKDDLVSGCYEVPALEGPTTVAVKIIDMLGEEALVTAEV